VVGVGWELNGAFEELDTVGSELLTCDQGDFK